jgi:hypothetical protein
MDATAARKIVVRHYRDARKAGVPAVGTYVLLRMPAPPLPAESQVGYGPVSRHVLRQRLLKGELIGHNVYPGRVVEEGCGLARVCRACCAARLMARSVLGRAEATMASASPFCELRW